MIYGSQAGTTIKSIDFSEDIPEVVQATPSISVSSGGLITASVTQEAGRVAAGTKSVTHQLTTQAAQTITPDTANKTIASGKYLTGTQTIKGDANLVSGNIKSGVSIFGVTGTYEANSGSSSGLDTSDATATSEDMAKGVTAYVKGEKITGNVPVQSAIGIDGATVAAIGDNIQISANIPSKKIMNSDAVIQLRAPKNNFGDATAADVASGKTFTSAAGLKVAGTLSTSSGGASLSSKKIEITTPSFNTGLSEIVAIIIKKNAVTTTCMTSTTIFVPNDNYYIVGCSSYSSYVKSYTFLGGTVSNNNHFTINGGIIEWISTNDSTKFIEGDKYICEVIGHE